MFLKTQMLVNWGTIDDSNWKPRFSTVLISMANVKWIAEFHSDKVPDSSMSRVMFTDGSEIVIYFSLEKMTVSLAELL